MLWLIGLCLVTPFFVSKIIRLKPPEKVDLGTYFITLPSYSPTPQPKLISMLRNPIQEVSTVNQPNISYHALEAKKLPKKGTVCVHLHVHIHFEQQWLV